MTKQRENILEKNNNNIKYIVTNTGTATIALGYKNILFLFLLIGKILGQYYSCS
jgi:hypothetical protein